MIRRAHEECYNLGVKQSLDGLSIDVSDQVTWTQTCIKCRTAWVNIHNQMMYSVKVRIPKVNPDSSDDKAKALRTSANDGRRLEGVD